MEVFPSVEGELVPSEAGVRLASVELASGEEHQGRNVAPAAGRLAPVEMLTSGELTGDMESSLEGGQIGVEHVAGGI